MRDNGPTVGEGSFVNHAPRPGRRPRRAIDRLSFFPTLLRAIPDFTFRVLPQRCNRLALPLLGPVAVNARRLARHTAQQDVRAAATEWLRRHAEVIEAVARMPRALEIRRRVPPVDREPMKAERLAIFRPAPIAEIAQDRLAPGRRVIGQRAPVIAPKPIHQRDIRLRASVFSFYLHRQL